jgi:hypothetical protein
MKAGEYESTEAAEFSIVILNAYRVDFVSITIETANGLTTINPDTGRMPAQVSIMAKRQVVQTV